MAVLGGVAISCEKGNPVVTNKEGPSGLEKHHRAPPPTHVRSTDLNNIRIRNPSIL